MLDRHSRLDAFLAKIRRDIYPEPPDPAHSAITEDMIAKVRVLFQVRPPARVLDIGCGQGVALEIFRDAGFEATGITLGEDVGACLAKGLDVREMDLTFLDFEDASFDLVWCRHALEHSIMPYFTLSEINRVLRPNGVVYVEVPAPDTANNHQKNPNHYSVLPRSMWLELIVRAGFPQVRYWEVPVTHKATGQPDNYWSFAAQKPA